MIIDTSAILAILLGEPESEKFIEVVASTKNPKMSAASYLEAALRIDWNNDPVASQLLDELLINLEIEIVPVTFEQAKIARAANKDFEKRSTYPASLNYSDCFTYALAKQLRQPLLFKGNDFIHTDLTFIET